MAPDLTQACVELGMEVLREEGAVSPTLMSSLVYSLEARRPLERWSELWGAGGKDWLWALVSVVERKGQGDEAGVWGDTLCPGTGA